MKRKQRKTQKQWFIRSYFNQLLATSVFWGCFSSPHIVCTVFFFFQTYWEILILNYLVMFYPLFPLSCNLTLCRVQFRKMLRPPFPFLCCYTVGAKKLVDIRGRWKPLETVQCCVLLSAIFFSGMWSWLKTWVFFSPPFFWGAWLHSCCS